MAGISFLGGGGGGGASFSQGTLAARPAASPNALYFATDAGGAGVGEWFVANAAGNAWQSIASTSALVWKVASQLSGGAAFTQMGDSVTGDSAYYFRGPNYSLVPTSKGLQLNAGSSIGTSVAGGGLLVAEGANAKQGATGAMTAGTVTVANTSVTANSRIFVCRGAGGTNPGAWYVSAQTAGTSFVVTSTNAADTGNGVFQIFEPG